MIFKQIVLKAGIRFRDVLQIAHWGEAAQA